MMRTSHSFSMLNSGASDRGTVSSVFSAMRRVSYFLFWASSSMVLPTAWAADPGSQDALAAGKTIYQNRCVFCHGVEGRGDGPSAKDMDPPPRDFVTAEYKIRFTPFGSLPTDEDLYQVVAKGMPGTAMAGWEKVLSPEEIRQMVEYIKSFSDRFDRDGQPEGLKIGRTQDATTKTHAEGNRLYKEMRCFLCHGKEGRGDGPITAALVYEWELPFRARNLTKGWTFKGGNSPGDIYRTISTGLNGTPMGSYADYLSEGERWSLAHYVASLSRNEEARFDVVIRSKLLKEDLPDEPDDVRWDAAKPIEIPLGAQIVVTPPSRWWIPTANSVVVKSLYSEEEIAFRIEWDDPTNRQNEVFKDGVAIKFPRELEEGPQKPYFIAEGSPKPLSISRWEATVESEEKDREEGSDQKKGGLWKNGRWSVVIKRAVAHEDFTLISFSVWDGSNRERGSAKAISTWFYVQLEKPTPVRVYVYVLIAVLAAIGVEWGAIRRLRRKRMIGDKALPV